MHSILRAIPRDLRSTARVAIQNGWTIRKTNGHHLVWKPPTKEGRVVHCGSTLSCSRAIGNIRAELRRNGLELPHR
jgi:hypothetical protein